MHEFIHSFNRRVLTLFLETFSGSKKKKKILVVNGLWRQASHDEKSPGLGRYFNNIYVMLFSSLNEASVKVW